MMCLKGFKVLCVVLLCLAFVLPAFGEEKVRLVLVINETQVEGMDARLKKIEQQFPQYEFVFKEWDVQNVDRVVKTMISGGNPSDIAKYWPNYMKTFVNSNMALDLTPYLEANDGEWKNTFLDGVLDIGKYNGKYYNVPYNSVYPMIVVNKDITDAAGLTLPSGEWTWDEFLEFCKVIKEKTGAYPFGIRFDWACWIPRNGMLSIWEDKAQRTEFNLGNVPFTSPEIVKVMEMSKDFYAKDYAYPGDGALAVKAEEVQSAFKQGKIAMMGMVNILASNVIKDSGLENAQVLSWPRMGPHSVVVGGSDGWFIASNSPHKEEAVEVLKYLTSQDHMQLIASSGAPVTVKGVSNDDPLYPLYSKDTRTITDLEVNSLSPRIKEIVSNKLPAEYIYNGEAVLEDLEKLRLDILKEKE